MDYDQTWREPVFELTLKTSNAQSDFLLRKD